MEDQSKTTKQLVSSVAAAVYKPHFWIHHSWFKPNLGNLKEALFSGNEICLSEDGLVQLDTGGNDSYHFVLFNHGDELYAVLEQDAQRLFGEDFYQDDKYHYPPHAGQVTARSHKNSPYSLRLVLPEGFTLDSADEFGLRYFNIVNNLTTGRWSKRVPFRLSREEALTSKVELAKIGGYDFSKGQESEENADAVSLLREVVDYYSARYQSSIQSMGILGTDLVSLSFEVAPLSIYIESSGLALPYRVNEGASFRIPEEEAIAHLALTTALQKVKAALGLEGLKRFDAEGFAEELRGRIRDIYRPSS